MEVNLKQQLESFDKGLFLESDGSVDSTCFVFYDWFCKDSSLKGKAKRLFSQVKTFLKHFDINTEETYVFFKNNCPMSGSLYDDFRICDIESGEVLYTVVPKRGHYNTSINGRASINGRKGGNPSAEFEMDLYVGNTLTEIYQAMA